MLGNGLGAVCRVPPPASILPAIEALETLPHARAWPEFWGEMSRSWSACKGLGSSNEWAGSDRIRDWTFHVFGQMAHSGAGRSLRSAQRRLQQLTGQNRKALEFFAKVDDMHRLSVSQPNATPADLAVWAGFADQSHMGRTLKRATGFSPVTLNRKIATEEPFWCYRLLGSRF